VSIEAMAIRIEELGLIAARLKGKDKDTKSA
jgi:hypothetical protein